MAGLGRSPVQKALPYVQAGRGRCGVGACAPRMGNEGVGADGRSRRRSRPSPIRSPRTSAATTSPSRSASSRSSTRRETRSRTRSRARRPRRSSRPASTSSSRRTRSGRASWRGRGRRRRRPARTGSPPTSGAPFSSGTEAAASIRSPPGESAAPLTASSSDTSCRGREAGLRRRTIFAVSARYTTSIRPTATSGRRSWTGSAASARHRGESRAVAAPLAPQPPRAPRGGCKRHGARRRGRRLRHDDQRLRPRPLPPRCPPLARTRPRFERSRPGRAYSTLLLLWLVLFRGAMDEAWR